MRWQNSLRAHGSADWVIIVVESNDNKKKNKTNILPRSSIVDKIRSDFCNKQNDRRVRRTLPSPRPPHTLTRLMQESSPQGDKESRR